MDRVIIIDWFDVYVQTDHPDTGADPDSGFSRGDRLPRDSYGSIAALDKALRTHGLPPLAEWEESDDEPGQYHTSRSEDGNGYEITDDEYRADPERELFLADYAMKVSVAETKPLAMEAVKDAS